MHIINCILQIAKIINLILFALEFHTIFNLVIFFWSEITKKYIILLNT